MAVLTAFTGCAQTSKAPSKKEKEEKVELEDNRYPDYTKTDNPKTEEHEFYWKSNDGEHAMKVVLDIDVDMYEYYCSLERFLTPIDGHLCLYVNDENNREILREIADQIKKQCDSYGYDESSYLPEAINFVQNFQYVLDSDSKGVEEYSKFPIETLYEHNGDCEDTSILLAGVARELGYDVIYIWYMSEHMAVGIKCDGYDGLYYEYDGDKYYYVETTANGWEVGEEPEWENYTLKYVIPVTEEE